jgi:hypothetical protein
VSAVVVVELAVLVIVNAAATLAVARRTRTIQRAITAADAAPDRLRVGEPIAEFHATAVDGRVVTERDVRAEPTLIVFVAPACAPSEALRDQLVAAPPRLAVVAFVEHRDGDGPADELARSLGLVARVCLSGPADPVKRAFRVGGFPTLYRVDGGRVVASGHGLEDVLP